MSRYNVTLSTFDTFCTQVLDAGKTAGAISLEKFFELASVVGTSEMTGTEYYAHCTVLLDAIKASKSKPSLPKVETRTFPDSSAIKRLDFRATPSDTPSPTGTLTVYFAHGGQGTYYEVPRALFTFVCNSASVGRMYNELIKGSFYYEAH